MTNETTQEWPLDCDAAEWGAAASVADGQCRCLVCARCGHHTGNSHQGHYWNLCRATKAMREPHFCCVDPAFGCELEAARSPGLCLCSHLRGSHKVDTATGKRSGPCLPRSCGCGSYRPDPRGAAGRQQEETRRSA